MTPRSSDLAIIQAIGNLPAMPKVASRVLTLADDPNCGHELISLLSRDGSLAASILKLANSVVFSRRHRIGDLEEAVLTVGLNALKGMVLAMTLDTLLGARGRIQEVIWAKSVGTAISAATLARHLEWPGVDEAFLLGLLHNLGQVVLLSSEGTSDQYGLVMELIRERSIDYVSAEEAVFGFSYPKIGALLAQRWNFPDEICEVILKHYRLSESGRPSLEERRTVVRLAELICHACGIGTTEGYPNQPSVLHDVAIRIKNRSFSATRDLSALQQSVSRLFAQENHLYRTEKG